MELETSRGREDTISVETTGCTTDVTQTYLKGEGTSPLCVGFETACTRVFFECESKLNPLAGKLVLLCLGSRNSLPYLNTWVIFSSVPP